MSAFAGVILVRNLMKHSSSLVLAALSLLAASASAQVQQDRQVWSVEDAQLHLRLPTDARYHWGMATSQFKSTAAAPEWMETTVSFRMKPTGFWQQVTGDDYRMVRYMPGSMKFDGAFTLTYNNRSVRLTDFTVAPTGESPSAPVSFSAKDANSGQVYNFETAKPKLLFLPGNYNLKISFVDLILPEALAARLGNPELSNAVFGTFSVDGSLRMVSGPALPAPEAPPANTGRALVDLGICNTSGISNVGSVRTGTFPTGAITLAISTTSTNYGTTLIDWFSPGNSMPSVGTTATAANLQSMNPNHPVIAQNIYRIENGRFEQIGESWLKHGWLATNTTECFSSSALPGIPAGGGGSCGGGSGTRLSPNCNDTYGASLNSDRTYLGAKTEVNPFTGVWTPAGSWFNMGQNDDKRRRNASRRVNLATNVVESWTPAPTENLMLIQESDLDRPGAQFFYEGRYVNQNEMNVYNQILWRQFTVTKGTSSWTFGSSATNLGHGPAINMWPGATRFTALPRSEGDVIVAVRTTTLPDGWTLYDYAVHNVTSDRQMDAFFVPVADSVPVRNISFRDIDQNAANQWTTARSGGEIRWTMQGGSNTNVLLWGRTYNFRFEANSAPTASFPQLDMVKPGAYSWLTAQLPGPTPSTTGVGGTLTLQGRTGSAPVSINVRLTPAEGGGIPVTIPNVSVDPATGAYTAQTNLRGQYLVSFQGAPFLRKSLATPVEIGPDGVLSVNASLTTGDVNGDNEVDLTDIDLAIGEYLSSGPTPADINGDGEVDLTDIDIIISNYLLGGDA